MQEYYDFSFSFKKAVGVFFFMFFLHLWNLLLISSPQIKKKKPLHLATVEKFF